MTGTDATADALVAEHLPMVKALAGRYRCRGAISREDLEQEGLVGLLEAAKSYRPDGGTQFKYWAASWTSCASRTTCRAMTASA